MGVRERVVRGGRFLSDSRVVPVCVRKCAERAAFMCKPVTFFEAGNGSQDKISEADTSLLQGRLWGGQIEDGE